LVSNLGCRGVNRVAEAIQASGEVASRERIENVGKWLLDESGKHPVNEIAEEISAGSRIGTGQIRDRDVSDAGANMKRTKKSRLKAGLFSLGTSPPRYA
jgi:hypothetical protein